MRSNPRITAPDSTLDEASGRDAFPGVHGEGALWWGLALAVALAVVALATAASLLA